MMEPASGRNAVMVKHRGFLWDSVAQAGWGNIVGWRLHIVSVCGRRTMTSGRAGTMAAAGDRRILVNAMRLPDSTDALKKKTWCVYPHIHKVKEINWENSRIGTKISFFAPHSQI
jgi:hypothetical protein